jgi:PadR family transcriptional regulator, regulatory protein PadR
MHDARQEARSWRSQLRKGTLELAVLLLIRQEEQYGLRLVERLEALGLGVSEGSIYPLLSRLRAEQKVETRWVDRGSGHAHKLYAATRRGAAACDAMLEEWRDFSRALERVIGGRQ